MEKRKVLRQRSVDKEKEFAKKKKTLVTNLTKILKKENVSLTREDKDFLEQHDELAEVIKTKISNRVEHKDRKKEWEDDLDVLRAKCAKLAEAIKKSKRLVVYTGAGISTSANIPDYRGPNGVWTLMDQGKEVAACDLGLAQPTTAHMALFMLYKQGKISHIVSQNCDGLHLRSGLPRSKLSEVHGNMFIEVCKACKPVRPFVRLFDVTERTNRYRHSTRRRCYICGAGLMDTIVHFGERGSIAWPINWNGASRAAEKADMILCLGSSLKVLRRYPWLWCMDRPAHKRPPLYIVNLQWTPKDSAATLKLNGRCDFVLAEVLKNLNMKLPEYTPYNDPLLSYATHLHEKEEHTTSRRTLIESKPVGVNQLSMEANVSPNGIITEVRVSNKFTTAKSEFQYMSSERTRETESDNEDSKSVTGDINGLNSPMEDVNASDSCRSSVNGSESCGVSVNGSESGHSSESQNTHRSNSPNDSHFGEPSINAIDHNDDCDSPYKCDSLLSVDRAFSEPNLTCIKKPKLESHSICDTKENANPLGDRDFLHHIMSQANGSDDFPIPFPTPDHNYAISPQKDTDAIKEEPQEEIKEEVKSEPIEDENEGRCTNRYKLRQKKSPRYNQFDEEYFILCQEELLKRVKKKHKKTLENKIKKAIEETEDFKELEYRTIEWAKDALYFSYEPNFLFTDDDEELEFVCDCCDPKRKKKSASSEEGSEKEVSEKEASEVDDMDMDEELSKTKFDDDDELNELLEDDSEDEQEFESREESPACEPALVIAAQTPKASKPLPPGWFGKGRRKKK